MLMRIHFLLQSTAVNVSSSVLSCYILVEIAFSKDNKRAHEHSLMLF